MSFLEQLKSISFAKEEPPGEREAARLEVSQAPNSRNSNNSIGMNKTEHAPVSTMSVLATSRGADSSTGTSNSKNSRNSYGARNENDPGLDPFVTSASAIKVYLPPIKADVWFCSDANAFTLVEHDYVACFLYDDLVYILEANPGTERLERLLEAFGRCHHVTRKVLKAFNGTITSIRPALPLENSNVSPKEDSEA